MLNEESSRGRRGPFFKIRSQQTWSTPVKKEESRAVPCALCGGGSFKRRLDCGDYKYVKCSRCSLVQINPQPEKSEVRARYGEDYLKYELDNEENFFRLGKLALEDADISEIEAQSENKRALEIGCATGALLEYLKNRGWEATGVEISAPEARYAVEKRGLNVSSLALEENHFEDGCFSLVTASHLIEHLNEPALFVEEVRRILVPGGVFLITTPNIDGFQARLFGRAWRSAIFDHLYLFSKKTLVKLLVKHGFKIEKIVTWGGIAQGFAAPLVKRAVDKAAKSLGFGDVMLVKCVKH